MNKTAKRVWLLVAVVCMMFALFTAVAEEATCEHATWEQVSVLKAGTCTTDGVYKDKCTDCGKERYISRKGHDYQIGFIDATCDHPQQISQICTLCGKANPVYIPVDVTGSNKLEHDIEEKLLDATCARVAGVSYTCKLCKKEVLFKETGTTLADHTRVEINTKATCSAPGYTNRVICYVCAPEGEEYTVVEAGVKAEIDPKAHVAEIKSVLKPADCATKTPGVASYTCSACKADLGALELPYDETHTWVVSEVLVAGNCGKDGKVQRKCSTCGVKEAEIHVIKATGEHKYVLTPVDATCYDPAYVGDICSVCGDKKLEKVIGSEALGHDFVESYLEKPICGYPAGVLLTCSRCGYRETAEPEGSYEKPADHDWVLDPNPKANYAATCSAKGWQNKEICSVCGYTDEAHKGSEIGIDANKHNPVATVVLKPADCKDPVNGTGVSKFACKDCGKDLGYETVPAACDWANVTVVAATCGKDGYKDQVCIICGDTRTVTEAKTGNHNLKDYTEPADCENPAKSGKICIVCGEKSGMTAVPGSSGKGHKLANPFYVEVASCKYGQGVNETCTVCGKVVNADGNAPVAHQEVTIDAVPGTCVSKGWTEKKICKVCGEITDPGEESGKDEENHELVVTVLKPANCKTNEAGYGKYECALCDNYPDSDKYMEIPVAEAHDWVEVSYVAPTCTTPGKVAYKCSICNATSGEKTLSATGVHKYEEVFKDADCENPARTGKVCTMCKKGADELTPVVGSAALGHKWGEAQVFSKATCYYPAGTLQLCSECDAFNALVGGNGEYGHKWVADEKVNKEATCKTEGWAGAMVCSVCGKAGVPGAAVKDENAHKYDVVSVLKAADCTKIAATDGATSAGDGVGKYACVYCGKADPEGTYRTIPAAKAHKWEKTIITPATCGENGEQLVFCSICNAVDESKAVIEATGEHDYKNIRIDADCENPAYEGEMCVVCEAGKEEMEVVNGTAPLGHKWGKEEIIERDCTHPYGVLKICSVCGEENVSALDDKGPKGHTEKKVNEVPATCVSTGWTEKYICEVCGVDIKGKEGTKLNADPINGHVQKVAEVLKPADCVNEKAGIGRYECKFCGKDMGYASIPVADAHNYIDVVIKDATCGKAGEKKVVCTICNDLKPNADTVIEATGNHNYVYTVIPANCDSKALHGEICSVCKAVKDPDGLKEVEGSEKLEHLMRTEIHYADCEVGDCIITYCMREGCKLEPVYTALPEGTEVQGALGHKYESADVAATCHTTGITGKEVCKVCGDIKSEGEIALINPKNHVFDVLAEVVTEATCTKAGTARYVCKYGCDGAEIYKTATKDHTLSEDKIDVLGTLVFKECSVCGYVKEVQRIVANNCTTHNFVAIKGFAATEEADGLTAGKQCSKCALILYGCQKIPMITCKHADVEILAPKAATCTEKGLTEGKKCNECGLTLVEQKEIPALAEGGHTEVVLEAKAATCTEAGLTEGKKCSVCEAIIVAQEEIAALGHKEVELAGKEATCTEDGLTAGKQCTVCEEITVKQEVIVAAGHTIVALEAKDATCEEAGLTAGEKCSVCGAITKAQEEITALGHKYTVTWDFNEDFTKKLKIFTCDVCGDTYTEEMDF